MPDSTAIMNVSDRLIDTIERISAPVCVGLDPALERLPASLIPENPTTSQAVGAIKLFCESVLHAVANQVPCVKFQSACFERYGSTGISALESLLETAKKLDFEIILDAKRGDIGISAEHYAAGMFDLMPSRSPDWITINSYLGEDSIRPFLKPGRGAFALVRTSNPGGDVLQTAKLANGDDVAQHVARIVAEIGKDTVGDRGYSTLGAVVGATKKEAAARLRTLMPQQIFLVPGFGAQGGTVEDILPCFNQNGLGALITASRSVIYAFNKDDSNWENAISVAAGKFADTVGKAVGMR